MRLLIYLCVIVLLASVGTAAEKYELDGRPYYVYRSSKAGSKPSMLVWLHPGSGDARPQFEWLKRSRLLARGRILLCPQAQGTNWHAPHDEAHLTKVITLVMKKYNVDPLRVHLGGHSSGGCFTWAYGLKHQEKFQTLIPACAAWHDSFVSSKKDVAPDVYIYHSTNDPVFPFTHAQKAKATLEKLNFTVSLLVDSKGHAIGPKFLTMLKKVLARKPKARPKQKVPQKKKV